MGRHIKPQQLPRRDETPHAAIPHDGPRWIATGSDKAISCFRCGNAACTCPPKTT